MSTEFERCIQELMDDSAAPSHFEKAVEFAELFGPTMGPPEIAHEQVSVSELFRRLHSALSTMSFIAKRPPNDLDKRRKQAHKEAVSLVEVILTRHPHATAKDCLSNKDMQGIYSKYGVRLPAVWYFRQVICKGMFGEAGRPRGTEETKLNIKDVSFLPTESDRNQD